jgi:hypothetical protein
MEEAMNGVCGLKENREVQRVYPDHSFSITRRQ